MNDLLIAMWQSHWLGVLLWLVLASILFAPMAVEWWHKRSNFDLFESKQIFRAVYFLYFGMPSLYYLFYPRSFNYIYDFNSALKTTLVFAIIGALFFYLGYRVPIKWVPRLPAGDWSLRRLLLIVAGATVLSGISFNFLMQRVGGACYYFTHLGQTNELMVGNTYFLWGILLFKSASLLLLAYVLREKLVKWWLWIMTGVYVLLSLLLVSFMGSRILAVVFVFEVLILIHYLHRRVHVVWLLGVLGAVVVVIVGILGEFRNFSWVAPNLCTASQQELSLEYRRVQDGIQKQSSMSAFESSLSGSLKPTPTITPVDPDEYASAFGKELRKVTSNQQLLVDRYINNYFDSVRTTMMVVENTPEIITYQYGTGYLQAIVQPIPRAFRPDITVGGAREAIFSEGEGYGRVVSLLGEAYMNLGWFGVALIPFILGLYAKFIYTIRLHYETNKWAALLYAVGIGGLMIYIRGYFVGHTALFLMDVIPLLLAMVLLHAWRGSNSK